MDTVTTSAFRAESQFQQPVKVLDRNPTMRARLCADAENSMGADKIKVSQDALLFTEALRGAQNAPDIRQDKIDRLRAQIADGTYHIDINQLAANIAREESALFQL